MPGATHATPWLENGWNCSKQTEQSSQNLKGKARDKLVGLRRVDISTLVSFNSFA